MTQQGYRAGAEDIIYLAACMVNGEKPDAARVGRMDIQQLYKTANRHMLTCIVGYALEAAGVRDPAFIQSKGKAIRKAVLFDAERAALLAELERAGIWHMPLKGCVLKAYYPQIGMRQMSDNDILFDATRASDVKRIMEKLGYSTEHFGPGVHDCYHKPPVCDFEMHKALFGIGHQDSLRAYYENVKDRLVRDDGTQYGYHFTPEDFYIYMIAHEYKHYSGGGTGLRSLLDTYVYLHKAPVDMEYVAVEVEKLGIADFEAANRSLALRLFGGETLTEADRAMLDYVLSSGTYGTMANSVRKQIMQKGRWGYFLSRMLLPPEALAMAYPVLARFPLLYPFCCVHRLIDAFFHRRGNFMYQLMAVLKWKGESPSGGRDPDGEQRG